MNQYEKLILSTLNIKPDQIEKLEVVNEDLKTHLFVTMKKTDMKCPYCNTDHLPSHGFYKKQVKLSKFTNQETRLTLKVHRYKCPNCNKTISDKPNITPPKSSISYLIIMSIFELLKNPETTFRSIARTLGIAESSVIRIFDKYCHLPNSRLPEAICIDEVHAPVSDYNSKFICIFYDFYNHTIYDILPERRKRYLHMYLQRKQKKELDQVRFVVIDMYAPYRDVAYTYFKKAVVCVDSFHVLKNLNESLSNVRIRIMRQYNTDSTEYYLLKKFKYLLHDRKIDLDNKARWNKKLGRYINYRQLLELILSIHPDLENGYHLKEEYTIFNIECTYDQATTRFYEIRDKFIKADIDEFSDFTTSLNNWDCEIINSFLTYKGRRVNTSVAESINSGVKRVLYNSKGIRNPERRKKRIMFAINKNGFLG